MKKLIALTVIVAFAGVAMADWVEDFENSSTVYQGTGKGTEYVAGTEFEVVHGYSLATTNGYYRVGHSGGVGPGNWTTDPIQTGDLLMHVGDTGAGTYYGDHLTYRSYHYFGYADMNNYYYFYANNNALYTQDPTGNPYPAYGAGSRVGLLYSMLDGNRWPVMGLSNPTGYTWDSYDQEKIHILWNPTGSAANLYDPNGNLVSVAAGKCTVYVEWRDYDSDGNYIGSYYSSGTAVDSLTDRTEGLSGGGPVSGAGIQAIGEMAFTVPEPATMALLGLGGLALLIRRRRR